VKNLLVMGEISFQRQGDEFVIRFKTADLNRELIQRLTDQLLWECMLRKAGLSEMEIKDLIEKVEIANASQNVSTGKKEMTEDEIFAWTEDIKTQWWKKNEAKYLEIINNAV